MVWENVMHGGNIICIGYHDTVYNCTKVTKLNKYKKHCTLIAVLFTDGKLYNIFKFK